MITELPRPAVFACYGYAWRRLWPNFFMLLLIMVINWVLGSLGSLFQLITEGGMGGFSLIGTVYGVLVGIPLTYGGYYVFLGPVRGGGARIGDLFVPFQRAYVASILSYLIVVVILVIGFLLLIIPGIFAAVRLSFVPFLVVDENLGPMAAIRESWRRTRGYFWRLFGAFLLLIPIGIVGLILLIVGAIPAMMWFMLTYATLFAAVTAERGTSQREL